MQSEQHTICACCGKDKPTPLRIDRMGGYVCLTCIDQKIIELYLLVKLAEDAENETKDVFWEIYPDYLRIGGDPLKTVLSHSKSQKRMAKLEEALQPFAQFGEWNVHPEDVYWLSTTQGERVCDWFGPSDFNNAMKAIQ